MRKRSFSIPDEIDIALKKRAADDNMRFSNVVIAALRQYLNLNSGSREKEKVSKKSHG